MAILRTNTISGIGTNGPVFSGQTKFDSAGYFYPPKGTTAERPSNPTGSELRFNTDSQKLEFYDGNQWVEMVTTSPKLNGGARGLFGGGDLGPASTNVIEYVTISSTGNGIDFGDLSAAKKLISGSTASSTRGLWAGGYAPPLNVIDYVTISSTGNSQDFGDLSQGLWGVAAGGSETRGLFAGGTLGPGTIGAGVNNIEYVTISSTGNAVDFGDISSIEPAGASMVQSPVRAVIAGGVDDAPNAAVNIMSFITIATIGNSQDFGDLLGISVARGNVSNSTRGLFVAGDVGGSRTNAIEYITISTLGNSINFGDLTSVRSWVAGASSATRGVLGGGATPTILNTIEYVSISSTGDALDFGDLTSAKENAGGCSNAHGGL